MFPKATSYLVRFSLYAFIIALPSGGFVMGNLRYLILLSFYVLFLIMPLWMIINCAMDKKLNIKSKIIWIAIIIFLPAAGALIYYWASLPKNEKGPAIKESLLSILSWVLSMGIILVLVPWYAKYLYPIKHLGGVYSHFLIPDDFCVGVILPWFLPMLIRYFKSKTKAVFAASIILNLIPLAVAVGFILQHPPQYYMALHYWVYPRILSILIPAIIVAFLYRPPSNIPSPP